MGVVYEAEDLKLGRHVALKFIPENLAGDPKSLERFTREARAASLLNHPNICTIHGIEDNNGHPFIVMERLEGDSLKQHIAGHPMPVDKVLDVGVQVADDQDFLQNVKTIFNNDQENKSGLGVGTDREYFETHEGKLIDTKGVTARYMRFYSKGSTESALNEYTEIEVYGRPAK